MWEMKKVKQSRKGAKTYTYWMASWREGGKTRNSALGVNITLTIIIFINIR
ncbi:MAG: hypothetical protein JW999_11560 [Methanotrichaceae archaeon]|nr:hypothetical protein [Methanotrichaceae archaeon]